MSAHRCFRSAAAAVVLLACACVAVAQASAEGLTLIETTAVKDPIEGSRGVTWINWQSAFRGTDLKVGDRIVGIEGRDYTEDQLAARIGIGDSGEDGHWRSLGKREGDTVRLTVLREGRRFEVSGKLKRAVRYTSAEGKALMGPGGPLAFEKDGFDYAWLSWYDSFVREMKAVLGWEYYISFDSCHTRRHFDESGWNARTAFLQKTYPGPFASAVANDWRAAQAIVDGEPRQVPAAALEFRQLGEIRATKVTEAAGAAALAFRAAVADKLHEPVFPVSRSPTDTAPSPVGKLVELPATSTVIFESLVNPQRSYFQVGDDRQGHYVVNRRTQKMTAIYAAIDRYIKKVSPDFGDATFAFTGIVLAAPVLAYDIRRERVTYSYEADPMGVLVRSRKPEGQVVFIDLRDFAPGSAPAFAGEEGLTGVSLPPLSSQSSPSDAFRLFVEHIKYSNFDAWREMFRTWQLASWMGPRPVLIFYGGMPERESAGKWDTSRAAVLTIVYDIEIVREGPVRTVYEGAGLEDSTKTARVEESEVVVRPVGKVKGEFRTVNIGPFKRKWTLQRLNGGLWKVANENSLIHMSLDQINARRKQCEE
jgi:hypothetical protein